MAAYEQFFIRNPAEAYDWVAYTLPLTREAWLAIVVFSILIPLIMGLAMTNRKWWCCEIRIIVIYLNERLKCIYNNELLTFFYDSSTILMKIAENTDKFTSFDLSEQQGWLRRIFVEQLLRPLIQISHDDGLQWYTIWS